MLADRLDAMPTPPRFLLTATLHDIRPAIWRTFDVSGGLSLGDVHVLLQIGFGWHDSHLHMFSENNPYDPGPAGKQWGPESPWETDNDLLPESDTLLHDLIPDLNGPLFYEYDFGDSWLISITADVSTSQDARPAFLTDGARRGPLEDCGGVPGYLDIRETYSDPTDADDAELREWVNDMTDGDFDPEAFDLDTLNARITGATVSSQGR